jgi:hypothetical protein
MVDDVHGLISRLVAAKAVHDAVTATDARGAPAGAAASVARKVAELYAPTVADDRPAFPGPGILLAGLERLRDQLR